MQPVRDAQLEMYANVIVTAFKNTCKSQSSTNRQCTLLPSDPEFVRKMYTNPSTNIPQEYVLNVSKLFANHKEVDHNTLNEEQLRSFTVIMDQIRTKIQFDPEAEMFIRMCEPEFRDPTASKIFRWYAYHYALSAGTQVSPTRL